MRRMAVSISFMADGSESWWKDGVRKRSARDGESMPLFARRDDRVALKMGAEAIDHLGLWLKNIPFYHKRAYSG